MCKGRNNKQCAAYCNIVTRKHFDMSVATYEYMKYQLKKTKQKKINWKCSYKEIQIATPGIYFRFSDKQANLSLNL